MFRFGIVSKSAIPTAITPPGPAIALTLLEDFEAPLSEADEARLASIYEMIVQGPLFSPMRTFPNRFGALDEAIADTIQTAPCLQGPIRVHDMAASNAITSLELYQRLAQRFGGRISLQASDYFDALYVVTIPGSAWKIVFDATGDAIQFLRGRLVLSGVREPQRYVLNRLLVKTIAPMLLRKARGEARRIGLFHPRCVALANTCTRFTLVRDNALNPETRSCDVLRIMNLSFRFPLDASSPWFGPACRTVVDGGLLVMGDEVLKESPLAATIFQRGGNHFTPVRDFEKGYEYRQAVLNLQL